MKNSIILFLFLIPAFLFAQYPATGNKSRLGYQTTGDGLIWRGVAADTVTKPRTTANAYFQLDTVNGILRRYIATLGKWQTVGGGGASIDSLVYSTIKGLNDSIQAEKQTLAFANPLLGISDGNNVDLSPLLSGYITGSGTNNRIPKWSAATNLTDSDIQDNGTAVSILSSKPFQLGQWTTAGRPSGVTGYTGFNSTLGYHEFYDGSAYTPIGFWNKTGSDIYYSTGSVGINTSTFPAKLSIVASTSNSSGFALDIKNSSGANILNIRNDQKFTLGSGTENTQLAIAGTGTYAGIYSPGYSSGTANTINFRNYNGIAGMGMYMIPDGKSRTVIGDNVSASATVASAALEVRSTDKGFLPPRWTAAQLAAIPSPATSLIGYQTDGTEGLYIKAAAGFKRVLWEGDAPPVNIYTGNGTFGSSRTGTLTDSLRFQFGGSDLFRLKSNGVLHVNMPTETNSFVITSTPNENYNNYRGRVFLTGTTSAFDTTTGSRRNNHEASYFSGINTVEGGYNVYYDAVAGHGNVVRKDVPQNVVFGVYNTVNSLGNVGVYGTFNDVSGQYTTVIGKYNTVPANYAFVVGRNNTVSQTNAFVYGNEISTTNLSLHGFGTLTPTERVDVGGNARIRGFLRVDGKLKVGSDSSFVHDPTQDTTYAKGTVRVQSGGVQIENTSLYPYLNIVATASSGNQEARLYMRSRGDFSPIIEFDAASSTSSGQSLPFYNYNTARGGQSVFRIGSEPGQFGARSIGRFSVFDSLGATRRFSFFSNGNAVFDSYGTGTKEAADLTKTQSNYIAGFATDGTVLDLERKRDTTIFLAADTDYNFSSAVTTAQIASRYNRIIIHMTITSGVGADKTTTLHTPDANLMQCEILIRGTDNTGTYDNEIAFGTNNAISSDGTNTSGYTLAQGQGLHVRVVYNGSAYKYIYY